MAEFIVFECMLNDGLRSMVRADDDEKLAMYGERTCEHPSHIVWWPED